MLEHLTGRQDARCQYLWFLHQSDGQNLWMLNLNQTHDHNWTCRARGSNAGGNIIHHVVLTNNGFSNAEIQVANQPSDYVPMMDHHTVVGFMNIHPPDLAVSQIKSSNDIAMGHNRPQLWYPQRSEKHKFENFHTMVNKEIRAKSIHDPPAICDESFILQYNTLTKIFKECSDTMFCRIRRDKKAINQFVMSPRIQKIQSDIRHINGAVQMTQEHFSVEVSQISIMVYHRISSSSRPNLIILLISTHFWSLRDVHSTRPCIMKGCHSYMHVPTLQTRNESLVSFLVDLQRNWCQLATILVCPLLLFCMMVTLLLQTRKWSNLRPNIIGLSCTHSKTCWMYLWLPRYHLWYWQGHSETNKSLYLHCLWSYWPNHDWWPNETGRSTLTHQINPHYRSWKLISRWSGYHWPRSFGNDDEGTQGQHESLWLKPWMTHTCLRLCWPLYRDYA